MESLPLVMIGAQGCRKLMSPPRIVGFSKPPWDKLKSSRSNAGKSSPLLLQSFDFSNYTNCLSDLKARMKVLVTKLFDWMFEAIV
jgi:hypothetical protein